MPIPLSLIPLVALAGPTSTSPLPPEPPAPEVAQLLKGERKRPTQRLRPEQEAAILWWQEGGKGDWRPDALRNLADTLTAQWEATGRGDETLRARLERAELGFIMAHARGTEDLAWVALRIYTLQEAGVFDPFDWVDDAGDWNRATIRSVEDLLYCRRNNCFCFVNLCAWLSGDQPMTASGAPRISHHAWTHPTSPGAAPISGGLTAGQVVVNAHRWDINNNSFGFQHTGIVVADGEIVHLGSRDLRKDPLDGVFARMTQTVFVGPFDWDGHRASPR